MTLLLLDCQVKCKSLCLICGAQVAVFKDDNINLHYRTKHEDIYRNLSYEECTRESISNLQTQQGLFYQTSHQRCSRQDKSSEKVRRFSVFIGLCCADTPRDKGRIWVHCEYTLQTHCNEAHWGHRRKLRALSEKQSSQLWLSFSGFGDNKQVIVCSICSVCWGFFSALSWGDGKRREGSACVRGS